MSITQFKRRYSYLFDIIRACKFCSFHLLIQGIFFRSDDARVRRHLADAALDGQPSLNVKKGTQGTNWKDCNRAGRFPCQAP